MTAKVWGAQQKPVEEIFFHNDEVSLCLLVSRRARTMRVVDFRAGPTPAKRQLVLSLAKREGVEKAYTLVERDEVATWVKLGFAKEGNIPAFYKRSDAFMLGTAVPPRGDVPEESETRILIGGVADEEPSAAIVQAERTLASAKKVAKELGDKHLPTAKIAVVREADVRRPVGAALKAGRALTAFEPFGRDGERRFYSLTGRGFEFFASTESQACFGNAFLELLQGPRSEVDKLGMIAALRALLQRFQEEEVVSTFSLSPSDDLPLATVFVANGFRRTGLLQSHLLVGAERKDAILWSKKLANPGEE